MADAQPTQRSWQSALYRSGRKAFSRDRIHVTFVLGLLVLLAACASSKPGPTGNDERQAAGDLAALTAEPANQDRSVAASAQDPTSPQDSDNRTVLNDGAADDSADQVVSRELVATWRISQTSDGEPGNAAASDVSMSADARYIAFSSSASNLIPEDGNGFEDVYLRDVATGETRLVSANAEGGPANGWSSGPAVSADGRYVAFYSWASDLAAGDANAAQDVFVYDRISGAVERVSVAPDGSAANDRSGDGRSGARPAISADGSVIAFHSRASNLVDADSNRAQDVFVYDRSVRQISRASLSTQGAEGSGDSGEPALSADGRTVAFASRAKNLDLFHPNPSGTSQIYVHDRETGDTRLISASLDGAVGNADSDSPALSGDGRIVAFSSHASNLIPNDANNAADIFLYDLLTGETERVSVNSGGTPGDRDSESPSISLDGRYVAYVSAASNLVNGDTNSAVDVYLYDRLMRHTSRVSVGVTGPWTGVEADRPSFGPPSISAGGQLVAFVSQATNLVTGEPAGSAQVYALERVDLPSFSLRGQVLDGKNRPLAGVTIAAGPHYAETSSDGRYELSHVAGGTYSLTPSREGYAFAPARRTVSVVADVDDVDFTGLNGGVSALAFLSLPVGDVVSAAEMLRALRDTEEGGAVDAWFDHDAPDYTKNGAVSLWDGRSRNAGAYNMQLGCYERRCYDGHDGTDFPYQDPDPSTPDVYEAQWVRPASDGRVAHVVDNCIAGDRWCNGGYGNEVIVYHDNGFFTRYSHLAPAASEDTPMLDDRLTTDKVLGVLGSTGNSFGAHLHFAVHQDDGNGAWDGEEVDLPVDPFGWSGVTADPWAEMTGPAVSRWMWREHPVVERLLFGRDGGVLQDLTGGVTVTVPPGAISGQVRVELAPAMSDALPDEAMRSLGRTFGLRVLDWYPPTGETVSQVDLSDATLALPLQIEIDVRSENTLHLEMERAVVQRWDEREKRWQPLPTLVGESGGHIEATSDRFGEFDLRAPLRCSGDRLEPDDGYFAATYLEPGNDPLPRLLDLEADEDWVQFDAMGGQGIRVSVDQIAEGVSLVAEIYDLDGLTALARADSVDGRPILLAWSPPVDGTYFVRVAPAVGSRTGCSASYSIMLD